MDPTAPASHAGHDELLIARLFAGDVVGAERSRALELASTCPECKSLLADLGAIAEATAAIPIPARPRDFSLTAADAARLRRPARGRWAVFGLGLRRSLGGSIAALGIVGIVLTGASSILSGGASTMGAGYVLSPERAAAPPDKGASAVAASSGETQQFGPAGGATAGPVSLPTAEPAATVAGSAGNAYPATSAGTPATDTASVAQPSAAASDSHDLAAASPGPEQGNIGGGSESTNGVPAAVVGSGIDARLVWLTGFAALFVIGLAIAILPVRRRGRDRGVRS